LAAPVEESRTLQACLNDLIAILALPAFWSGREPSLVIGAVLDALVRMQHLDFACLRLHASIDGAPGEIVRWDARRNPAATARAISYALASLPRNVPTSHHVMPNPGGSGEVRVAAFRLGLRDDIGLLVAASRRPDFPTRIESLLLEVAENQVAIALQDARHTGEQRQAAKELGQRVAERTQELTAVNAELRRQMVEGRRSADELRRAHEELTRVTRVTALGELAASIAHEVNQPLAAVVVNAQACLRWLAGQPPNLAEVRACVERVVRDGNRAAEVVARIRAFVRRSESQKAPVDVREAIEDVLDLIRDRAQFHQIALQTTVEHGIPLVLADRVQLQQVVLNLAINAIEAMRFVSQHARVLQFSASLAAPGSVLVAVRDSGDGLDPTTRDRVFEAFYTTKRDGMGMGLAISRSIVEEHGGRLWTTANDGPGETFQFTLPAALPASSAAGFQQV
jgi:C4-dicarboxylate-specific signal transduction histidine kinase